MSQAIDKTADFMTPDVAGWSLAGRVKYSGKKLDVTAAVSRGWGENHNHGKEISADIWTVSVSGTIKF